MVETWSCASQLRDNAKFNFWATPKNKAALFWRGVKNGD